MALITRIYRILSVILLVLVVTAFIIPQQILDEWEISILSSRREQRALNTQVVYILNEYFGLLNKQDKQQA